MVLSKSGLISVTYCGSMLGNAKKLCPALPFSIGIAALIGSLLHSYLLLSFPKRLKSLLCSSYTTLYRYATLYLYNTISQYTLSGQQSALYA